MTSKKQSMSVHEHILFIVLTGVMGAISVVLAWWIHFPLVPAATFLEYDPADIVIYICTYLLGLPYGLVLTLIVSVVQGITVSASSGPIGIVMHIISTGSVVLSAGLIYRAKRLARKAAEPLSGAAPNTAGHARHGGRKGILRLVLATGCGIVTATVVMILWNVILTPIYMEVPRSFIVENLLAIFIPFNLLKATINGVLSAVLFIPIQKAMSHVSPRFR